MGASVCMCLCAERIVELVSGGSRVGPKWDGAHHSTTVEQLTNLSRRALGENGMNSSHHPYNIVKTGEFFFSTAVKSWDGGDNTIDSSKMEGEGGRRERDSWDAELDKGKVSLQSLYVTG